MSQNLGQTPKTQYVLVFYRQNLGQIPKTQYVLVFYRQNLGQTSKTQYVLVFYRISSYRDMSESNESNKSN